MDLIRCKFSENFIRFICFFSLIFYIIIHIFIDTNQSTFSIVTTGFIFPCLFVICMRYNALNRDSPRIETNNIPENGIVIMLNSPGIIMNNNTNCASIEESSSISLYTPKKNEINNLCCTICLISLENYVDVPISKLKCNHIFHKKCIKEWYKNNRNCPICRTCTF